MTQPLLMKVFFVIVALLYFTVQILRLYFYVKNRKEKTIK